METIDLIDANALIKQGNPIVLKKQYKKVCKNVKEMSYKELISHLMKELMGYAMSLTLKNEFNEVLNQYKNMDLNVKGIESSALFLKKLSGIEDPEKKRKIIGNCRVFL